MCETEKKTYTNKKQKEYLLEFVKTNPKIVANKFENNFTKTQINSLWQEATDELNKLGVKKTKEQWRKTWADMKNKFRSKMTKSKVHARGTGGGPCIPPTKDDHDEEMLQILGNCAIDPISETRDRHVPFEFEENKENTSQNRDIDIQMTESTEKAESIEITETVQSPELPSSRPPKIRNQYKKQSRLQKSIEITQVYLEECKTKNEVKKKYYEQKLLLMKEQNSLKRDTIKELKKLNKFVLFYKRKTFCFKKLKVPNPKTKEIIRLILD